MPTLYPLLDFAPATRRAKKAIAMYLTSFPLLLLPFAFFNIVIFLLNIPLTDPVFTLPLMSAPTMPPVFDRHMTVTTGDLIVAIGMLLLYVEVVKSARPGGKSIIDHVLSFILFIAMAAELLLLPRAESPTLLLLTVLSFVDAIAGISIRPAQEKTLVLEHRDRAPA
ncbi:MAG: hypothetical protein ACXU84_22975 [Xanthobacteraceae bacterium]